MRRKLRYLQSAAGHHAADFIAIRLALRCPPQIKQPRIPAGNLHALIAELRRPSANALQPMERRPIPRKLRQKNPRSLDRPHCSPQFHLVAMMISGETLLYSFSFLKRICSGPLLASPVSSRGECVLALARKGSMRPGVSGTNSGSAEGLSGLDHHQSVVPGAELRVLPQTVRRNPLARSSARLARQRPQDRPVERDSRRKTPGSAEHPLACLLELPHCRIHSPRASRIGG